MWKKAFKSLKSSSSDAKLVSYAIKNMYVRNIPTFISLLSMFRAVMSITISSTSKLTTMI